MHVMVPVCSNVQAGVGGHGYTTGRAALTTTSQPMFQALSNLKGDCLPGARPAGYLCVKYPISSHKLSSPREVPEVDHTRPQTFPARHLA